MHLANALMFIATAMLLMAQKNVDGTPLMYDWHGIAIAVVILAFNALLNAVAFLRSKS